MNSTTSANALIPVSFRNTSLTLIDQNGEPFVAMKPVVTGMGLTWEPQAAKLRSNPRWGMTMIVIPSEGGGQQTNCMPLRKLPGWLTSISPNKVRPELRATIIAYQNECDDVLWQHWNQSRPIAPPKPAAEPERLRVRANFPFPDAPADRDHKAAEYSLGLLQASIHLYVDDPRARARMTEYAEHLSQCLVRVWTEIDEAQRLMHFAGTYLKRWSSKKGAN